MGIIKLKCFIWVHSNCKRLSVTYMYIMMFSVSFCFIIMFSSDESLLECLIQRKPVLTTTVHEQTLLNRACNICYFVVFGLSLGFCMCICCSMEFKYVSCENLPTKMSVFKSTISTNCELLHNVVTRSF